MKALLVILFLISYNCYSQEFNDSFLGASKEEVMELHPKIRNNSEKSDTLSTDRWYKGVYKKKEYLIYFGEVGEYPVRFEYWFYDGDFLEGVYNFVENHPDPEQRIAISSTAILEILKMKYGNPDEVVGNVTIWKIFERVKYTIELMTTANQSPQILYRWNRRVDSWHKKEIKKKSKDF